mmetsp:Transcript_11747/g.24864  ORF Transcript_11747/g.24864 Transcript_11747/m.24864 type:complete len:292 (+) Transcript_11747:1-876(+)
MMFNRRPFLDKIYQEKVTSIGSDGQVDSSPNSNVWTGKSTNDDNEPFNVALHIRRGDSCNKEADPDYYSEYASPLNSTAQFGTNRQCYKTKVYLDALRQIRRLVPETRPLHVYLATDHVGSVIDEIVNKKFKAGNKGSAEEEVIEVERWHFLNYSRDHFNYDAGSIESEDNREHQPILGETAVADLWHLSHGHAFVGHMGSRFGKVAWLLATARYNTFIPFSTVDGHSFCCEIDEPCARMKPFITVDNCLTFGHEFIGYDHETEGSYWEVGSLARKSIFLDYQEQKKKKDK